MSTTIPTCITCHFGATLLAFTVSFATTLSAAPITATIEPDDFGDGQVLNHISPYVTLSTRVPPANAPTFDVVAYSEAADASTGTKVFAHAGGVPFWNTSRTLRMDFNYPATSISLDYIASGFVGNNYAGRLEAYSSAGILVSSYVTALLGDGQHETMTVTAPQIAYAIAYPPSDPFGDLDHLTFSTVPESAAIVGLLVGAVPAIAFGRRNRLT